uniref:Helicase ATP-binding domain-containing protein n=1 Tax=viral metagenome TaxID=1070528 RepID=A0A6C0B075_9ZZZZ
METEIGPLGYSITLKTIPAHFVENIRSELTVKPLENPNFSFGENTAYPVYRISKNKIYLPRFYGTENYKKPKKVTIPEPESINLEFNGTLRDIQQQTIDATLKAYTEYGGGLISLDTGLGKTVVALKLVSLMKVKTLIIVHAEFLLEQWKARIEQYLPGARIGIIRQTKCETENVDISIGMIQTIISRDYPKDFFKSYGQTVIDECHHISSKTFSSIFYKVQTKYMIGLSATPERKDGLSKVIYWFLGPQIITIKRETNKPSIKFVMNDSSGYTEKFNVLGKVNSPQMITDLTKQDNRNLLIINLIKEQLKFNRKILVLSDRRDHCEYFHLQLQNENISSGVYLGGMKTKNREESVNSSVILGTYQASGEGFDVPELDTLILATPKSDVEQAVGRILRQKNNNEPIVFDIVDSFSLFKGQYYKRRKFYKINEFLLK